MINFDFNKSCTGCLACADVCVRNCISYKVDQDGFLMPIVDKHRCNNCSLCEKVCPALNYSVIPFDNHKCYAAYNYNLKIRHYGSSGSVFFSLAEFVLTCGGIVYGASFDDNLQLHHSRATTIDEVYKQMKSKYIQSDTSGIYKLVLNDLRAGIQVLFVGTPCQCRALHNLTPHSIRKQLLLVDIICHGVPSQVLFNKAIEYYEHRYSCKVVDFVFREKTPDKLRRYKLVRKEQDDSKTTLVKDTDSFPYYYGFSNQMTLRNSCYDCKQREINRASDLTLGDFWGIDSLCQEIKDFAAGYSVVITNTDKGNLIMNLLKDVNVFEVHNGIEFVAKRNWAYIHTDSKSLKRRLFFLSLRYFGYAFCEKHFLQQYPSILDRLISSMIIRVDKLLKLKQN